MNAGDPIGPDEFLDSRDYMEPEDDPDGNSQRRDPAIDQAADSLRQFFNSSPTTAFYSTQIETALETKYFHWITRKALVELSAREEIRKVTAQFEDNPVNFYANKRYRYYRREINMKSKLLKEIFDPSFTQAVGQQGELMFDSAFSRNGFQIKAQNVKEWKGRHWTRSNHNLDRVITRDDLYYGVEIKNTQNYITLQELEIKIELARHLGLIPLFVIRFAPKNYIYKVRQRGGFTLLFEKQLYPFGHSELAQTVSETLGLKVSCPRDVPAGHIERFVTWHNRRS